jgi:hypothetical protein
MSQTMPTQQQAEDALYEACARQWHEGRGGRIKIGDMTPGHLKATIRSMRGNHHAAAYRVVLERKERGR